MKSGKKIRARRPEAWVRRGIIYEIYLRSFTSQGTLAAAEEELPRLKNLGVTILWLMPIHPIGEVCRKGTSGSPYAVRNYFQVNPEYGTFADVKNFLGTAHRLGFRVMMDLVIGHAAWDNPLLALHPGWFRKGANGNIRPPRPEWSDVAAFDYRKRKLREYMLDMMNFWISEAGFDGFRCDYAESVPLSFWEEARRRLDRTAPVIMLSETDHSPAHHRSAFDLSYSTPLYETLVSILREKAGADQIQKTISREKRKYPAQSLLLRFTSNHDKNIEDGPDVSLFGEKGSLLAAAVIQTIPGVPMLYNGQEYGFDRRFSLFHKTMLPHRRDGMVFQFYQKLFSIRKKYSALTEGACTFLPTSLPHSAAAYIRSSAAETIMVILNCSKDAETFFVDVSSLMKRRVHNSRKEKGVLCFDLMEGKKYFAHVDNNLMSRFELPGRGWKILMWERKRKIGSAS